MDRNMALKLALAGHNLRAYEVGFRTDIRADLISRFVNGMDLPTQRQAEALSEELGIPVPNLFPRIRS